MSFDLNPSAGIEFSQQQSVVRLSNYSVEHAEDGNSEDADDYMHGRITKTELDEESFDVPAKFEIPDDTHIVQAYVLIDKDTNEKLAIRFKTQYSCYDMNIRIAEVLGFRASKLRKGIYIRNNGSFYASEAEYRTGRYVEDISKDTDACEKLLKFF